MAEERRIFNYARVSAVIDDPDNAVARGVEMQQFDQPCPYPVGSPAVDAALESNGRMPVAGMRGGTSTAQVVLFGVSLALIILGVLLLMFGSAAAVAGAVLGLVGVLLFGVAVVSVRKRIRALEQLSMAWRSGWLRFAPARVGGVWISSFSRHGNQRDERDSEVRFRYRALVEVYPTDGSAPFRFHTSEFTAPSSRNGKPVGLNMVEGPLDHFEPEFTNGWTIARWVAGNEDSATITTDLSIAQIRAALRAS